MCKQCPNQAAGPSFACASTSILVSAVFKSEDSSLQPPTTVSRSANCRPGTLVDTAPTLRAVSVPGQQLAPSRRPARNAASVGLTLCLLSHTRWQHFLSHKPLLIPPPTGQRKYCLLFCRSCCANLHDQCRIAILQKLRQHNHKGRGKQHPGAGCVHKRRCHRLVTKNPGSLSVAVTSERAASRAG